ncbi:MAG: hypothetical protein HY653_01505 [Acidobacteria bacterium]|nr:hypothetical protein [Acidobacteriota bacterium]
MTVGEVIALGLWFILVGAIALLGLFYARQWQEWQVTTLKRLRFSALFIRLAESKYALWQTRFVGLFALAMFVFVLYELVFGNLLPGW